MSGITLRNEVWQTGTFIYHDGSEVSVQYKYQDKLTAIKCDCCSKIFKKPGRSEYGENKLILTMDKYHPSHTETIWHDVCSIECGERLVKGEWKRAEYDPMDDDGKHPFVNLEAEVKDYKLSARTDLISHVDLIKQWESSGRKPELTKCSTIGGEVGVGGEVLLGGTGPARVEH